MKIELFFPLFFMFSYNLLDEIWYWFLGFFVMDGDAGVFLQFNLILNREICVVISLILYAVVLIFLLKLGIGESYWKKLAGRIRNFISPHNFTKN